MALIHTMALTLHKEIGELSENRIGLLVQRGFQVTHNDSGRIVILIANDGNYQIQLTTNSITIGLRTEIVEEFLIQPDQHFKIFENITDALLLNPVGIISFQMERSYDTNTDSLKKAWSFLQNPDIFQTESSITVGYRIPIVNSNYPNTIRGEIKIEPFLQDSMKYFIALALQGERQEDLNSCLVTLKNILGIYRLYEEKAASMFG